VANELERAALPVAEDRTPPRPARLLAWMHDGHFVFLGYRHYHLKRGARATC
jgi:NAD-specific glutamate dehydrogenase